MKNLLLVFALAFALNFIWEYFHSKLYVAYQGAPITPKILLRASLFDAVFIVLVYVLISNIWPATFVAALFAIALELFALKTSRWEYKKSMPIIPWLQVGLTPVIQLPLITYVIFKIINA